MNLLMTPKTVTMSSRENGPPTLDSSSKCVQSSYDDIIPSFLKLPLFDDKERPRSYIAPRLCLHAQGSTLHTEGSTCASYIVDE